MLKYLLLFLSFANSNSNDSSVLYGEENGTDFVDAVGRLAFDMSRKVVTFTRWKYLNSTA